MGRWQWVLIPAGLLASLGAVLLLADSLLRLYTLLALFSPLLAQIVAGVILAAGTGAAGFCVYRLWPFLRPRRQKRIQPPRHVGEAARVNLRAVQAQVDQIQDQVARQALHEKAQGLYINATDQPLNIAVFGVGSAGKTALINGLLGQPLGEVGAALGTTRTQQAYAWKISNVPEDLRLIDTPGIAEIGIVGTEREQAARTTAAQADLILFVIDDDLRQAEYTVLQALMNVGKRVLLVLNKADRYPAVDLEILLERLRTRLIPPLSLNDIIAVAALPQPLPQVGGGWLQMQPNLWPLQARLADLLRQEGKTIVADNLLLQTQQIGENARQLIDGQRQTQADTLIERYQWLSAGAIVVTPIPGLDFLATAAINAQMVVELSQLYGCEVSIEEGKALALSVAKTLTGLGLVKGTVDLLALGFQTNLATALASRALKGTSGAYLTRIAGKSFVEYFRQNQSWGDGGMNAVVERQFHLNQRHEVMKAFIKEAINRVVPIASKQA
ncbi:MAG: GTP-binding protein [Nodosilinea sp.]